MDSEDIFHDAIDWEHIIETKEECLKTMAEELIRKNEQLKAVTEEKKMMEEVKDCEIRRKNYDIELIKSKNIELDKEIVRLKDEIQKRDEKLVTEVKQHE